MSDEADLSTEQAGARPSSRLPRADGDAGRPQGAGQSPRQGPGEAERVNGARPVGSGDAGQPEPIEPINQPAHGLRGPGEGKAARSGDLKPYTVLAARKDFVAANAGRRAPTPGFVLLVRVRDDDGLGLRAGFTVTKKIGNAVVRNRLKRRLRAAARAVLPGSGIAHADHVLIGRGEGLTRDFAALTADLAKALAKCAAR